MAYKSIYSKGGLKSPSKKKGFYISEADLRALLTEQQPKPGILTNLWENEIKPFKYLPSAIAQAPGLIKEHGAYNVLGKPIVEYYKGYKHPIEHFKQYPLGTTLDALTLATLGGGLGIKAMQLAGVPARSLAGASRAVNVLSKIQKAGMPTEWVKAGRGALEARYLAGQAARIPAREMSLWARLGGVSMRYKAKSSALWQKSWGRVGLSQANKKIMESKLILDMDDAYRSATAKDIQVARDYGRIPLPEIEAKYPQLLKEFNASGPAQKLWEAEKNFGEWVLASDERLSAEAAALYKSTGPWKPYANRMVAEDLVKEGIKSGKLPPEALGNPKIAQDLLDSLSGPDQIKLASAKIEQLKSLGPAPNLIYTFKGKPNPAGFYIGRMSAGYKPGFTKPSMSMGEEMINPVEKAVYRHALVNKWAAMKDTLNNTFERGMREKWARVYKEGDFFDEMTEAVVKADMGKEMYGRILAELHEIPEEVLGGAEKKQAIIAGAMAEAESPKAFVVPREVYNVINNFQRGEANTLLRAFVDAPTEVWRELVLKMSPRWLAYNIVGNVAFKTLQSVNPWQTGRDFRLAMNKELIPLMPPQVGGGLIAHEGGGPTFTSRRALQDILPRRQNIQEVVNTFGEKVKVNMPVSHPIAETAGAIRKWLTFLGPMNERMERVWQRATFMHEVDRMAKAELVKETGKRWFLANDLIENKIKQILKDPVKSSQAYDMARDYMQIYFNLSPFERGVMRRIFPFYSWYKNMARLMFVTLPGKHPARMQALNMMAKIGREAWLSDLKDKGIDESQLPDFMKGAIPIDYNPKTKEISLWNTIGVNPFTTISEMDWRQALSSLTPLAKVAIERAIKEDLFRGRKFESMFVYADPMGNLREYDPKTGRYVRSEGKAPPLAEHLARQVPQYGMLKNWLLQRKYGGVPSEYAESTAFNLRPVLDVKTGKPKYISKSPGKFTGILGVPVSKFVLQPLGMSKLEKATRTGAAKKLLTFEKQGWTGGK